MSDIKYVLPWYGQVEGTRRLRISSGVLVWALLDCGYSGGGVGRPVCTKIEDSDSGVS